MALEYGIIIKIQNHPNAVHPVKAGLNTGMSAYGLWVNPVAPMLYYGVDAFYPGGWPGAMEDQQGLYEENKSINPDYQLWPGAMKQ